MAASQANGFFGARHVPFFNVDDTVATTIVAVPLKSRASRRHCRLIVILHLSLHVYRIAPYFYGIELMTGLKLFLCL